MDRGGPGDPTARRVGQGLRIYAGVLFLISLVMALFADYPFSVVAWGVAAVSAAFIAFFIVIPGMRA
jgi:hypothetical protein